MAAKVENANGGDPSVVLHQVRKVLAQRSYDHCLVLMDTDRQWPSSRPTKIGRTKVTLVPAAPVIEGLLLRILAHAGTTEITPAAECKRALYRDYVEEKKRTEPMAYKSRFTREMLDTSRQSCLALDTILRALE